MPRSSYKVYEKYPPYYITSSIVDWLPLFSNTRVAHIILTSLNFIQSDRDVKLYCYVILENHIHLIAQSDELEKNMRAFKSYTARQILDCLKLNNHTFYLEKLKTLKLKKSYRFGVSILA